VLVVLGMIVILAGIAWPAIARYRERSNRIH
jgi:type II secretory pathway pseudopilin PulG